MPGTHHGRKRYPGRYHHGSHRYHVEPSLPGLDPSPYGFVNVIKNQALLDQYEAWTENPLTLQVVDKVGVPILQKQVSRDTTIDEIRKLVISEVRQRHANVLNAPATIDGEKHRTYTVLTDVGIYKIENYNDAYSGELRELQFGERLDGCRERKSSSSIKRFFLCMFDTPMRLGYAVGNVHSQSVVKLLYSSSLKSAKSRSSHHKSWKSASRYSPSWTSDSHGGGGSGGGGSCGSGGSCGGGGGSG